MRYRCLPALLLACLALPGCVRRVEGPAPAAQTAAALPAQPEPAAPQPDAPEGNPSPAPAPAPPAPAGPSTPRRGEVGAGAEPIRPPAEVKAPEVPKAPAEVKPPVAKEGGAKEGKRLTFTGRVDGAGPDLDGLKSMLGGGKPAPARWVMGLDLQGGRYAFCTFKGEEPVNLDFGQRVTVTGTLKGEVGKVTHLVDCTWRPAPRR